MNFNVDAVTLVVTIVVAVMAGGWTLYRFVKGLEAKAKTKEKEVAEGKCAEHTRRMSEIEVDTQKSVAHAEEKFALEQQKAMLKIDYLEKEVEALSKKQERDHTKHDDLISGIRDILADMRETIAGFGKDFVTRREFLEEKRRDGDA